MAAALPCLLALARRPRARRTTPGSAMRKASQ